MAAGINWRQAFAEVGLLLAGVGIAVVADSVVDERRERQEEAEYLVALASDLALNSSELESVVSRYEEILTADSTLLALISSDAPPIPEDSLPTIVQTGFMIDLLKPVMGTYTDMVGSGDLRLLQSDDIRIGLAEFEEDVRLLQMLINILDTRWAGIEEPFIIRELPAAALYDGYRGVLTIPANPFGGIGLPRTREFANVLVLRMVLIQDILIKTREVSTSLAELRGLF